MIALPSTKSSPKTRVWEQLCSQGSSYLERAKRPQYRALVLRLLSVPLPGSKTHLSWTEFPPKTVWSQSLGFILIVNKASFSSNSDSLLSPCVTVGTLGHLCWRTTVDYEIYPSPPLWPPRKTCHFIALTLQLYWIIHSKKSFLDLNKVQGTTVTTGGDKCWVEGLGRRDNTWFLCQAAKRRVRHRHPHLIHDQPEALLGYITPLLHSQ